MEFKVNGIEYRAGRIDARKQFHIVRRLAPVLSELAPAAGKPTAGVEVLTPLANAIAKLTDSDADYVIFGLLDCVKRKQDAGLGWAAVNTGTQLMFEDIDMPVMLQLAWQALKVNLSGFFSALPSDLKEALQSRSGQSAG